MSLEKSIDDLNALLPQTQCQLCKYPGCKPYAEAIILGDAEINRCLPGGIPTLKALGKATQQDYTPYLETMKDKAKPESIVKINEPECIGCTKCIKACPVDAIIGASKQMHSIINEICTGCDLCIPVCPTDCIDTLLIPARNASEKSTFAEISKDRYDQKQKRLLVKKEKEAIAPPKQAQASDMIAAALAREQARKKQP